MKAMTPQLMIAIGQPTWIPRMAVPAQLEAYIPGIISLIQIEVESKMGQGPLRMHAHNLLAVNNFQNEDFVELADIVIKYIHVQMMTNAYNNVQAAVANTVSSVVGMWSAAQVRMYPDLMQYLTREHQQVAMEAVESMAGVVGAINQVERGNGYGNPNYGGGGGSNGSLFQNDHGGTWGNRDAYSAYSPGGGGRRQDLFSDGYHQNSGYGQQPLPNYSNQGGSGLFRTGERQQSTHYPVVETATGAAASMGTGKMSRQRIQLMRQQGIDVDDEGNVKQQEQPATADVAPAPTNYTAKWGARTAETANTNAPEVVRAPAQGPAGWDKDFDRLASLETPPPIPASVTRAAPAPKADTEYVEPTDEEVGEDDWRPSEHQQYHPAWTSATQKVEYHKTTDGTVLAVVVNLTQQEKEVNENDHAIGTKSLMRAAFERAPEGNLVRTETPAPPPEAPQVEYTFVNNDEVQVDVSERTTAMIAGVVGRASGLVRNKTDIWHTTTWVVEPVLCANDEVSEYLDQLTARCGECQTFNDLLKVMREMTGQDEVALRSRINQSMTRAINDVIAFNISPKVYMDDFENDWESTPGYLRKKHGDRITDALLGQQREIIRSNLLVAQGEDHETMTRALMSTMATDPTVLSSLTYLACRVTHSHMQFTAQELSLAVPRRGVGLLTEQNTPLMEAVAQEMFSGKFGTAGVVARRFIVTSDGLVLQVTRSLLNPSSFLVRVID